jgi:hypothetical protein
VPLTPSDREGEPETRISELLRDLRGLEARQAADHEQAEVVSAELKAIMRSLIDARRDLDRARRGRVS